MKNLIKRSHFALYILLTCVLCVGCSNVKKDVDMTKFDGAKLIDRQPDWGRSKPAGAYIHTFRKGDRVWSESYMYGCFSEYNEGDIIRAVGNAR